MTTKPDNPGVVILLVIASIMMFAVTIAAVDELNTDPSLVLGMAAGLAIGGIGFAALRSTKESRPYVFMAFAFSIPTFGFLILQSSGSDDGLGTMAVSIIASWLAMPFAIALANKKDAERAAAK